MLSWGMPESGGTDRGGEDGSCPGSTCLAQAMSLWEVLGSTLWADGHWGVLKVSSYKIRLL